MASANSSIPKGRIRWRRHRYPERLLDRRQETIVALIFGILGLALTSVAFLSAESLMCAIGEWTECPSEHAAGPE